RMRMSNRPTMIRVVTTPTPEAARASRSRSCATCWGAGADAIALMSMSAALALGQPLAGAAVALLYSDGNILEDIAVARAGHDLRSLVDRARMRRRSTSRR